VGMSLWGGGVFLSGMHQDNRVLSGTHQDGQERIRIIGSCQEHQENQNPARSLPGACQDDQDDQDDQGDQENQNPVRRPPGSWHPNNLLMSRCKGAKRLWGRFGACSSGGSRKNSEGSQSSTGSQPF
jgi:hypothetical protein